MLFMRTVKSRAGFSTDNNHHFGDHVLFLLDIVTLSKDYVRQTLSGSYTQGKVSNFKFHERRKAGWGPGNEDSSGLYALMMCTAKLPAR